MDATAWRSHQPPVCKCSWIADRAGPDPASPCAGFYYITWPPGKAPSFSYPFAGAGLAGPPGDERAEQLADTPRYAAGADISPGDWLADLSFGWLVADPPLAGRPYE